VVEHPAFAALYQGQLAQEGLPIEITEVEHIPSTTISIYPDGARKDVNALEISIPVLTAGHRIVPKLEGLTIEDVKTGFGKYKTLPLGGLGAPEIEYEGRHLFTGEVIERMKIDLPLLESGIGAISYYVKQLEQICKIKGLHTVLAPLIQTFLEEILFNEKTILFDPRLASRLGNSDVAEHIRAVFVPLIRSRITTIEKRMPESPATQLSRWKPYQVTHSERRPALEAKKTLFNLVPCNHSLEVAFTEYADRALDITAFAKNAGPQCLRIDYLGSSGQLAFYTPDFFARTQDSHYYLIETKGREDIDVPRKVKAAIAWCKSASTKHCKWEYVYTPQGVFERLRGSALRELVDTCRPALQNLLEIDVGTGQQVPLFAGTLAEEDEKRLDTAGLVSEETLARLPSRYRRSVEQATMLFRFLENKEGMNYAPIFTGLLGSIDEAARGLIVRRLQHEIPPDNPSQKAWFDIYLPFQMESGRRRHYESMVQNLKKTLIFNNGISPIGLLRSCLDALNDNTEISGVFESVKEQFRFQGARKLLEATERVNNFRNTRIAHQEEPLTDKKATERELIAWVNAMKLFSETPSEWTH
jgi:type III restriction enzyme